jgi:hypothetical protein
MVLNNRILGPLDGSLLRSRQPLFTINGLIFCLRSSAHAAPSACQELKAAIALSVAAFLLQFEPFFFF